MRSHQPFRQLALAAAGSTLLCTLATAQTNERCTVSSADVEANAQTSRTDINATGRYVVYSTTADNLVPNDTNGTSDVFVRDTQLKITQRLSLDANGLQVDGNARSPRIIDDGSQTVFSFDGSKLVDNDTNGVEDIFVKNWATGAVERVNLTHLDGEADGASNSPDISGDGERVVYASLATNLVPGDTNGKRDIYYRNLADGKTLLISQSTGGVIGDGDSFGATLSGDGLVAAFYSDATNLVAGDTNGERDVFVHYMASGKTFRMSTDALGNEGDGWSDNASLSYDGRYLCFRSTSTNLVPGDTNGFGDIFVKDLWSGTIERVNYGSDGEGNVGGSFCEISDDGRFVCFDSVSTNLAFPDANGSSDIYLHDRHFGVTTRNSVTITGGESNGASFQPRISADGQRIVYWSFADNLASGDSNGVSDVFLADIYLGPGVSYCEAGTSASGCQANLYAVGVPSPSTSFAVHAAGVEGQKDGILFFGTNGPQMSPWGTSSSFQCVVPPVRRTAIQSAGGSSGTCTGSFNLDFTDWINNHPGQQPAPGAAVFIQAWFRDPANTSNQTTTLSDGFRFYYRP